MKKKKLEPKGKGNPAGTTEELKSFLMKNGAAIVGVADLSALVGTNEHLQKSVRDFSRAVSIGIRLSDKIIEEIKEGPTEAYAKHYRLINNQLDEIAMLATNQLQREGYKALMIPASKIEDKKRLAGEFPHKTAAILSGLGWIGRSALLITFHFGPRVRLVTVLTDAPLRADAPQKVSLCGTCKVCVEACPAKAIKGSLWKFGDLREKLFDAQACHRHLQHQEEAVGEKICGVCIAVCPFGKNTIS